MSGVILATLLVPAVSVILVGSVVVLLGVDVALVFRHLFAKLVHSPVRVVSVVRAMSAIGTVVHVVCVVCARGVLPRS